MITDLFKNDLHVLLVLSVNLLTTISYFFIIINKKLKDKFYSFPMFIQKIYVLLFVVPLFISPFLAQVTYNFSAILKVLGLCLSLIGVIFILFSFLKIGVIPSISKSELVSSGTYKIVRHPIYSGTLFLFLGLTLINSSVLPLFYFPLSILLYYLMTIFEEKDLIRIFGNDYILYRQNVKYRIIPFVL
jgi:protein-S-isoprenylcysteine O-methyltransferase Ste14